MIPGMIGTVTPSGACPRDEVEVHLIVEEEVRNQVTGAGVGLALRVAHVLVAAPPIPGASPGSTRRRRRTPYAAVMNSMNSLPCASPPSVGTNAPARRRADRRAARARCRSPRRGARRESPCSSSDGRVDAGQVRDRLDVQLAADTSDELHRARADRTARAVRHRHERRLELAQMRRSPRRAGARRRRSSAGRTRTRRPAAGALRGRCRDAWRTPCYGHANACGIRIGSRRRRPARQSDGRRAARTRPRARLGARQSARRVAQPSRHLDACAACRRRR